MEWSLPGLGTAMIFAWRHAQTNIFFSWTILLKKDVSQFRTHVFQKFRYCHNLLQCLTSCSSEPHQVLLPEVGQVVQVAVQTISCCKTVVTHFWLGVHVLCSLETWQPWLGDCNSIWTDRRSGLNWWLLGGTQAMDQVPASFPAWVSEI